MRKQIYCLACRKYTKSINPKIVRNEHNRSKIQSNCAICGRKKSRFIKEHQVMGLLSNLGIKTPLNKVPSLNIFLKKMQEITCLSCKKDTRNIDPRIAKTKTNKRVMSSKCSVCNNKKSTFISQGYGLFGSLGLNTPQNRMKNALRNTFVECL